MLYVDFPDAQAGPESIIVQVTDRQGASGTISVGWCQLSPTAEQLQARPVGARFTPLLPRLIAESFFDDPDAVNRLGLERSRVEIIEAPRHGRIGQELSVDSRIGYVPESGFVGNDRAVFLLTAVVQRIVRQHSGARPVSLPGEQSALAGCAALRHLLLRGCRGARRPDQPSRHAHAGWGGHRGLRA